jgi:peptidoglycan DL-endopeptidase CwlO
MGTRAKLVAFSLGTLAIALLVWVLLAVPTPQQPPDMVEGIDLEAPRGGEQRADGGTPAPTAERQRQRSRRGDRRPRTSARRAAQERRGAPNSGSISTGEAGAQAQDAPPDRAVVVEAPTRAPRGDSGLRAGGSPTPRSTPVSGPPPAPRNSPREADSPPEPAEPADPPDAEVTSAAADTPEEPEPADSDPPEEPEPADSEPAM